MTTRLSREMLICATLTAAILAILLVHPVRADDGGAGDPAVIVETETRTEDTMAPETGEMTVLDGDSSQETGSTEVKEAVGDTLSGDLIDVPETTSTDSMASEDQTALVRDSGEIQAGDPFYTVGAITYRFYLTDPDVDLCAGDIYCVESDTPIQAALVAMESTGTPSDRRLYIDEGIYTEIVEVNGTKTGVKGLTGLVGMGDDPSDVEINGSVIVHDFPSGFTISNMTVNASPSQSAQVAISTYSNGGTLTLTDVSATASGVDGVGIVIRQSGNVVLDRVTASNNGYQGANIKATGSTTVKNSEFFSNLYNVSLGTEQCDYKNYIWWAGLAINAPGGSSVSLSGISIQWNNGDGAAIMGGADSITVKDSVFSYNGVVYDEATNSWDQSNPEWGDGLYALGGIVTVENVEAVRNGLRGIYSEAWMTFTGSRLFAAQNLYSGIEVVTCIKDIYGPNYCLMRWIPGNVVIRDSEAIHNNYNGIRVYAQGVVTISDTFTGYNGQNAYIAPYGGAGIHIDNSNVAVEEGDTSVPVPVFLTRVVSEGNSDAGIEVFTKGAVTGTNVIANGNGDVGILIDNDGVAPITFKIDTRTPYLFNETCYNVREGFIIYTFGAVSLTSLDSYGNGSNGGYIDNIEAPTAAPVTITVLDKLGTISSFAENDGFGVYIKSNGIITLVNVEANYNQVFGAYITNIPLSGTAKPAVNITNSTFSYNCAQDDNGVCFDDNEWTHNGLQVASLGVITITGVAALENYGAGLILDNDEIINTTGVNIKSLSGKTNYAVGNKGNGVEINSYGLINVANLVSSDNGGYGLLVNNGAGIGPVTITGGYFNGNINGLFVETTGAVLWKNGSADNNHDTGASISNNVDTLLGKPVTIVNVTTNFNSLAGLAINTKGAVTLTNVESNNNSANYLSIGNGSVWSDNLSENQLWYFNSEAPGIVTIVVKSDFFTPAFYVIEDYTGYLVDSTIRMGSDGVTSAEVGITDGGLFIIHVISVSGDYTGLPYEISLYVGTTAPTTMENYSSNAKGIYINNSAGLNAPVIIKNPNWYASTSMNSGTNLEIYSSGAVTLENMALNDSSAAGLLIDNTSSTSTPTVSISNVVINQNKGSGVEIITHGAVVINKSSAYDNSGVGYLINNKFTPFSKPVTLTNVSSKYNSGDGIAILSNGIVTLKTINSSMNSMVGLSVDTMGSVLMTDISASANDSFGGWISTPSAVTLNKPASGRNSFGWNALSGLTILSSGKVILNCVDASVNGLRINDESSGYTVPLTEAYGIQVSNVNDLVPQAVIISGASGNGNTLDGLNITTSGIVTINWVDFSNNYLDGISIDQSGAILSIYPVTINNSITNQNRGTGLSVKAKGNILLGKFTSSYNHGEAGVVLDNSQGSGTVTVSNPTVGVAYNGAIYNINGSGVIIRSKGNVIVTGVQASGNGMDGLEIDNSGSGTAAFVTVNSIGARANFQDGIDIYSNGVVTVNSSWTVSNGGDGLMVHTPANTFLTNASSLNNGGIGIKIFISDTSILTRNNVLCFGNDRKNLGVPNLSIEGL